MLAVVLLWIAFPRCVSAETIARCGAGWLETIDGYLVLHVKGTPYEMGYQHGALVNVTYAGFIVCVTGMNIQSVSIGEMGGGGLGHWAGMPMALLVREALSTAHDLDEAIAVFRDHPRTCQYFYVVADGKTNRA